MGHGGRRLILGFRMTSQPPRPSRWACPVRSRPGRLNIYGLGPSRILSLMLSAERSWSGSQQEPATVCQPAPSLPYACPG